MGETEVGTERRDELLQRAGAILLALAAIVGVAWGTRASLVSSSASDAWQSAIRQEVKRAAAVVEDVRYVYVVEGPQALDVFAARIRAKELRKAAARARGTERAALTVEAEALETYASQVAKSVEAAAARYRTSIGGFDHARRLADQRAKNPDLRDIDPEDAQEAGDRLSRKSLLEMLATVPAAFAFMLGAVSEGFRRGRALLLALGAFSLAASVVLGLVFEFVEV